MTSQHQFPLSTPSHLVISTYLLHLVASLRATFPYVIVKAPFVEPRDTIAERDRRKVPLPPDLHDALRALGLHQRHLGSFKSTRMFQETSLLISNCTVRTSGSGVLLIIVVFEPHLFPIKWAYLKSFLLFPKNTLVSQTVWEFALLMSLYAGYLPHKPSSPPGLHGCWSFRPLIIPMPS